jgi:signal transduction histidine kinase
MRPDVEVTLLRVAQEALANVAKHASAARVGLTLSYMPDEVALDVRDDGIGFDPAALPGSADGSGFGLTAMRQRVEGLDGTLQVESESGAGTAISACVPAWSAGAGSAGAGSAGAGSVAAGPVAAGSVAPMPAEARP